MTFLTLPLQCRLFRLRWPFSLCRRDSVFFSLRTIWLFINGPLTACTHSFPFLPMPTLVVIFLSPISFRKPGISDDRPPNLHQLTRIPPFSGSPAPFFFCQRPKTFKLVLRARILRHLVSSIRLTVVLGRIRLNKCKPCLGGPIHEIGRLCMISSPPPPPSPTPSPRQIFPRARKYFHQAQCLCAQ